MRILTILLRDFLLLIKLIMLLPLYVVGALFALVVACYMAVDRAIINLTV